MSFPPPPVESIDWTDLGFKVSEVNGHIESTYSKRTGKWTEPEWVTDPYLHIHGFASGINYGQHAFEGTKAFRSRDNKSISIFRPDLNAERFAHSAEFISIPSVPKEHFLRCIDLAVALNASYVPPYETGASMYIRPLIYGSSAQLGLNPPEEYTFVVLVLPTAVYHGVHPIDCLILEEFDRTAPRGTGSTKVGGNYAPVMRWSEKARNEGFGITLHLDSKTRSEIDEFSTAAFVGVKYTTPDVYTLVVPDSSTILKSVTCRSACELALSFGWKVEKRAVPYNELEEFDEVFAAGTAAALVPVKSITYRSLDKKYEFRGMNGEPGPAVLKLLTTLKGIQQAKIEDKFGWLYTVNDPTAWLKGHQERKSGGANGSVDNLP